MVQEDSEYSTKDIRSQEKCLDVYGRSRFYLLDSHVYIE